MKFNPQERDLSLVAVLSIIWTFVLAYVAYTIFENKHPDSLISIWNVWDTQHYLKIAEYGYTSSTADKRNLLIVFFPLYPYAIKLFALIFKNYLFSALLVSNLAYAAAVFYLYKLVKLDFDDDDAYRAVIYISVFPTAYFLHAAYTESLFLALAIACFYYARKEKWPLAGILGMLAAVTRITGIILLPVLIIEYLNQKDYKLKDIRINILWISIIALGLVFYLAINYYTFGDPFKFLEIQMGHWNKHLDLPFNGLRGAFEGIFWRPPRDSLTAGWAELLFAVMGLALIIYSFFRIRLSYSLFALSTWLVVTSTSYWLSIPRYTLSMFPVIIMLAIIGRQRVVNYLILFASISLYTLLLIQFIRFGWAF
ncbi:MAG TPA: glycosyltransferase family 39 protein [Thermodesulfobacteriota bacterium]|nr:glycosyltransferase family 39 protein [Thermodesulfobacteriota bacterium]